MRALSLVWLAVWAFAGGAFKAVGATNRVTPNIAQGTVEYRGETIRLSRAYFDYDQYKNDPNNIHPEETARVQALVTKAHIDRAYPDRASLFEALSKLSFPGYGSGSPGNAKQADGTTLLLYEVEIPRADATRYLVFRERAGTYALIDDFVEPDTNRLLSVSDAADGLAYTDTHGKVTVRKPARK